MNHDPWPQFHLDWSKARESKDVNAYFCTLATVTEDGFPAARIVGLRDVDNDKGGFLIETNQTSPKFHQLEANGKFQLLMFWNQPTMIQYRITGQHWERLDDHTMEERWKRKAKTSQLLDYCYAHHHPHSTVLQGGREEFLATMNKLTQDFANCEVPFQPIAAGLWLKADAIEEWRGSVTDRLHERYLYQRTDSGSWTKEALVP